MSEPWPSEQTGGRRTKSAGRPRPEQFKTDWITPLVLIAFAVAVLAGIGSVVAPFILDTFQQVTDVLPTR